MNIIEDVITEAVEDSTATPEPVEEDTVTEEVAPAESETPTEETETPTEEVSTEVTPNEPVQDEFEKKFGVAAQSALGRENRIPYSRVKKITEKAVNELAETVIGRKLNAGEKALDTVKAHVARIPELEGKVTDYENRLSKVGEFEDIMANQPQKFLQLLSTVPAYKDFFEFVEQAYNASETGGTPPVDTTPDPAIDSAMPLPNETLDDGSMIYNEQGIADLLEWKAKQTEARVTQRVMKQIEDRYKPIESEWKAQQQIKSVLPVIRAQITEAKTWPQFNENEDEITKALAADPKLSLEGAYRKIVLPKLAADRDRMRQDILREVKTAPRATNVTSGNPKSSVHATPSGNRKLEDIIAEQVATLK